MQGVNLEEKRSRAWPTFDAFLANMHYFYQKESKFLLVTRDSSHVSLLYSHPIIKALKITFHLNYISLLKFK